MDYRDFKEELLPKKSNVEHAARILREEVLPTLIERAAEERERHRITRNVGDELMAEQYSRLGERVQEAISALQAHVHTPAF